MISIPGSWKSIEELEDSVTMDDLITLLNKRREMRDDERKFTAMVAGVEMAPANGGKDRFEDALQRAQDKILAEQGGTTAEEHELTEQLGITFRKE